MANAMPNDSHKRLPIFMNSWHARTVLLPCLVDKKITKPDASIPMKKLEDSHDRNSERQISG
jgi:hypothetical protein